VSATDHPPLQVDDAFAARLIDLIRDDVAGTDEPVEPATDLLLTGLVDSLGVVVVVDWIEQQLGIEIDPGDVVLEHFQTVDLMLTYLRNR